MPKNPNLDFIPDQLPTTGVNADDIIGSYGRAGLGALKGAPINNVLDSDAFAKIMQMLGPGAGGGLSPALMQMFGQGQRMNAMGTSAGVADAQTDAVGRGLEGSTVETAGTDAAKFRGSMADSNLMAQLFGMQNQNQGQLSGMMFAGETDANRQVDQRLQMLLQLLSGTGENMANIGMFNQAQNDMMGEAERARQAQWTNALIGAGGSMAGGFLGRR